MSDKEHEVPVKVVDRRWWANQENANASTAAGTAAPSQKPTYVEELEQKLAEKDKQLQDAIARYRGASAEFDESRLRIRREIAKDIERGRREILADLLDVVDNLDRALDAARSNTAPDRIDTLLQGVELVRRQFLAKLEGFGVTRIESEGQKFDPALHDAVSAVPAATPDQDGTIVGVVRHGYRIGDDVLRPAAVAVAQS
ncbi:MAG TPA: nucleotide exchange factor GrpE [Vicinamibacterales bacterium]|nr:nucleotide exchange factor GrpE [Vicinamibacterales bacterium]